MKLSRISSWVVAAVGLLILGAIALSRVGGRTDAYTKTQQQTTNAASLADIGSDTRAVAKESAPAHPGDKTVTLNADSREYARSPAGELPRTTIVGIARQAAEKGIEVPGDVPATVHYEGESIIVVWEMPRSANPDVPRPPGPAYYAKVTLDPRTGRVIEVLGAP